MISINHLRLKIWINFIRFRNRATLGTPLIVGIIIYEMVGCGKICRPSIERIKSIIDENQVIRLYSRILIAGFTYAKIQETLLGIERDATENVSGNTT
jgi:hypothetical protein